LGPVFSRIERAIRQQPLEAALALVAIAVSLYVVVAPLAAVRYPPITDLPFHAAHTSALRHYADPSWHFREQFELHPIAVPYLSMYAIGAALMLLLPAVTATKIAGGIMLALLPAGLAVLLCGMKRSPLGALACLGLVWCSLTNWGFLNFMGALGLFAMAIGWALLQLRRPSRLRALALALTLVALFFTHIFRFPFGLAAVVGTVVVMAPALRRFRPIVLPMLPSLGLLAAWLVVRPKELGPAFGPLSVHWERLPEFARVLFGSFNDPAEQAAVDRWVRILAIVFALSAVAWLVERRPLSQPPAWWWFPLGATLIPLCCALVFLGLFLVLPMQMGAWWYVYPREATATAFISLAAFPSLPRAIWLRTPVVGALAFAALAMTRVVVANYRAFEPSTQDYYAITRELPQAPKLLYLVFDHSGSTRTTTPYIHLPAYVQAERGGWLSFHFAVWGASPLGYRSPDARDAVVPPKTPLRWEWTPQVFRVNTHGTFFDWFLVRQRSSPDGLFRDAPSIERVDHRGMWWLYRRRTEGVDR
jgi:hypothetical protein